VCIYVKKYFKQRTQKPEDGLKKSGTITSKFCGFSLSFAFLKRMGNPEQIKAADILY